jgi:lipopolysaccharide biosynthesis glycosyltransferase
VSVIEVGCAVEGGYLAHSAAMLHSLLDRRDGYGLRVHYLHDGSLPAADLSSLARMVESAGAEIEFAAISDEVTSGLPIEGFTGKVTWYRAFVADLLPAIDRILFLDVDLIATDSLAPLWDTDVSGHYLAAVTNVFQEDHVFRAAEIGLDRPDEYFNAGVMLMNLESIRCDAKTAAIREYGQRHSELMFRDQDALNVALSDRRLALHPRWNVMNAMHSLPWAAYAFGAKALEDARAVPAIRHFEGPAGNKPWAHDCWAAQRELYFEHRRQTPWPEIELEGVPSVPKRVARRLRRRLSA